MPVNIALDGPSGAGKSTLAKRLAAELGYTYVDTGALYRTIGLYVIRHDIDSLDTDSVIAALDDIHVSFDFVDGLQHVYLNGEDVTFLIRTPDVSMAASVTSAIPEVRAFLLDYQRDIARKKNVIMDGRDIGTVILPDAQVKFFVTVSAEVRAERRYKELVASGKGEGLTLDAVLKNITERDENDSSRSSAPLRKADDAVLLDNSGSFEDVVKEALRIIREKT